MAYSMQFKRGIAQLEFVLVLVVLIPLFLALLWSGMFGVALSNITISVRHEAWRQRQEVLPRPFEFDDSNAGKISESSSASVELGSMFDDWATPKSTCSVFGGSWDHRVIKLNENSPNRDMAIDIAKRSPQAKLDNIQSKFSSLKELVKLDNLNELVSDLVGIKSLTESFNGLELSGIEAQRVSKNNEENEKKKSQEAHKADVKAKELELDMLIKREKKILDELIPAERKKLKDAKSEDDKKAIEKAIGKLDKEAKELKNVDIPSKTSELDLLKANPMGNSE